MNLRELERESIRSFVEKAGTLGYLKGRVLDYGCGKQPYRSLVESFGAEYVPYDRKGHPGNVSGENVGQTPSLDVRWDAILCTQVVQYVPLCHDTDVCPGMPNFIHDLHMLLEHREPGQEPPRKVTSRGHLVMTYPTNWPEVEAEDLHRFTKAGMERLLTEAGFEIVLHERRAMVRAVITGTALKHGVEAAVQPDHFALGYGVVARA